MITTYFSHSRSQKEYAIHLLGAHHKFLASVLAKSQTITSWIAVSEIILIELTYVHYQSCSHVPHHIAPTTIMTGIVEWLLVMKRFDLEMINRCLYWYLWTVVEMIEKFCKNLRLASYMRSRLLVENCAHYFTVGIVEAMSPCDTIADCQFEDQLVPIFRGVLCAYNEILYRLEVSHDGTQRLLCVS